MKIPEHTTKDGHKYYPVIFKPIKEDLMSSYREIAEHLIAIGGVRGIGHTTLMINGIKSKRCIVIGHTIEYAKELAKKSAAKSIPAGMNSLLDLQGLRLPIAIDHNVVMIILRVLTSEIRELEQIKEDNKRFIETLIWERDQILKKVKPKKSLTRIILDSLGSFLK